MRPMIAVSIALAILILFTAGVPQIGNGGFETPPPLNSSSIVGWSQITATDAVQRVLISGNDCGMPKEGQRWLTFSGAGSSAAIPPSNPGGFGTAPLNVVYVAESFQLSGSNTTLELDVAFLCNEQLGSAYRDFVSVDLSDGQTSRNLRYLDNHSAMATSSNLFQMTLSGNPMPATAVKHIAIDIPAQFPNATDQTTFTIQLSVGNAIDASLPSRAYFDDLKFSAGSPMPQMQLPTEVKIEAFGTNGDWLLTSRSTPWPYGEVYNVFSANTSQPLGAGPFAGIVPDYATYFSIWQPLGTHPFHVGLDQNGVYQFVIPSWVSPGVTGDLFMAVLYAGQVVAISPAIRHTF